MPEFIIPGWLVLASLPSLAYALSNHMDKYLLDKHFIGELGVLTLLFVSALVSGFALPFLWGFNWYFNSASLMPEEWWHLFVFVLVGLLHVALVWFYLMALKEEDTTTVVVCYSMLPILGLVTSKFFLGEVLNSMQLVAMVVTITGMLIVSIERKGKNTYRFKLKAVLLMFMASLCWALGDVAFKFVALEENVLRSLFWEHVVLTIVGVLMYFFSPKIREEVGVTLQQNSWKILRFNLASETLYIVANIVSAFPLLMVQIAAVHLVQAFQPVWVFLIALLLLRIGVADQKFTRGQLVQKGMATVITVYGMYLLAAHTPSV